MARTDHDTGDLATSVGAAAAMVAAARAAASRRRDPVINDPFAEPLVRAVGLDAFTRMATGECDIAGVGQGTGFERMTDIVAARTRHFDQYFRAAISAGVHQAVIVACGLDSRAYRLQWSPGSTVYEIDRPEVVEFKTRTLAELGAVPLAWHRIVGMDLRDDWMSALQRVGFNPTVPTAWLAEGLFIGFLPAGAQDRILAAITDLSAPGSRFAADSATLIGSDTVRAQLDTLVQRWRELDIDIDIDIEGDTHSADHQDLPAFLRAHGWTTATSTLAQLFVDAGLPALQGADGVGAAASIGYVIASRG